MTATLRASIDSDAEAIVALRRTEYAYTVMTPAALRHAWLHEPPAAKVLRLAAEVDGEFVAYGWASFNTWTATAGACNLGILVRTDVRGQGIGAQLHDRLMDHLVGNGATRVQGWGDGDDIVGGFAARRGFERRHELR